MNQQEQETYDYTQPRVIDKSYTIKYTGEKIVVTYPLPTRNPPEIGTVLECIEQPKMSKTTYHQPEEKWFMHNNEPARIFRHEYNHAGFDEAKANTTSKIKYKYDLEKACQEKCAIGIDDDFTYADGWIDCDGNFHAIGSMQHESHLDELRQRFNRKELAWFFQNWVKISLSMWSGLHIWSSESYARNIREKMNSVTARQKLAIEKYLDARPYLLEEGKSMDFHGYGGKWSGTIRRENGKIIFSSKGDY